MPTETNAATKDRPFDVGQLCAMGVLVETKLGHEINKARQGKGGDE